MTFEKCFTVICDSVVNTGYDRFLPSLCISGFYTRMKVLECDLTIDGEEEVAKQWASNFSKKGRVMFLAYRSGGRCVDLVEIHDTEVVGKKKIEVEPFE